jgi:hypothetical protein
LSYIRFWQFIAHAPEELSAAERMVAVIIANRIKTGRASERIPQRTLLEESGVRSKRTVQRALVELQILEVIRVDSSGAGSRKADLITWLLECPADCDKDHSKGNAKRTKERATRPNPDTSTRPNPDTPLRSSNKERDKSLLDYIEEALNKLPQKNPKQEELLSALADTSQRSGVRAAAELLAVKAEQSPENYLAQIAISSPHKLLPRAPRAAKALTPPDLRHLPREVAAERLAAWERDNRAKAAS